MMVSDTQELKTPAPSNGAASLVDGHALRKAMGKFATGVTIITAQLKDGVRVGLTANSLSSVSLEPPLVSWNLSETAPSLDAFKKAGHFAVHILGQDQENLALRFSRPADDKFEGLDVRGSSIGAPVLPAAVAVLECETVFTYYGGDHVIFLGRVVRIETRDAPPLLFVNGGFASL
ncbi:MAG: flavin reductase family protein [Rhodospirillales bacterium]|jgi:3-hydroxy-9,10-secoandrosta-1,3,5(10)-triene-9,17-dione monooxygenase reductase component